ncbi:MAG TPA: hypothetical protein P5260_08640 [Candidatus Competibacter sp.]|jgi:hypothetical protein|nr:hypothetical protein [Candidatus Competibacter sp.]HRF62648.1 hypothetical protein [Candidatus Competibacter sp.]HRX61268.1 hypothetical protein [Candidatus Competibacter sp.]
MENETDIIKLQRTIELLQCDIQRLASPYEDALSNRVFDGTKKKLFFHFGTWATIVTGALALFGFNAYDKIVSGATDLAIKKFSEKAIPELQQRAEDALQKEMISIINEKMKNFSFDAQTKLDSELSQVIKTVQSQSDLKLNQAIKEIGVKLNDAQFAQQTQQSINEAYKNEQTRIAEDGWSFYGVLNPDGGWRARYFEVDGATNNADPKPSVKDKIRATTDVNLRSDAPTYSESDGWNYSPIRSVINYGQVVTVQNIKLIKTPKGEYYWVQVAR